MSEELESKELESKANVNSTNLDEIKIPDFPENATIEQINEILSELNRNVDTAQFKDIIRTLQERKPKPDAPLSETIAFNIFVNNQIHELEEGPGLTDPDILTQPSEAGAESTPPLQKKSSSNVSALSNVSATTLTFFKGESMIQDAIVHEALKGKPPPKAISEGTLDRLANESEGPPPPQAARPVANNPEVSLVGEGFLDDVLAESDRLYEKDREKRQSAVKDQRREKLSRDEGKLEDLETNSKAEKPREIFRRPDVEIPKNVMPPEPESKTANFNQKEPRELQSSDVQSEPLSGQKPLSTGVFALTENASENASQNVIGGGKKRRKKTKKKKKSKKRKTKRRYKTGKRN